MNRICSGCDKEYPLTSVYFPCITDGRGNKKYFRTQCYDCYNVSAAACKMGITAKDYWDLYNKQGGRCAICGCPPTHERNATRTFHRNLAIDHCHTTKQVRGLLCYSCNLGLGRFEDDPEFLRSAADYIESSQNN